MSKRVESVRPVQRSWRAPELGMRDLMANLR
jgi:hypothetical protein